MDRAPAFVTKQIISWKQKGSARAFESKYVVWRNNTNDYKEQDS